MVKTTPFFEPMVVNKNAKHLVPYYLAKNYWWAYLSPFGVNFFDHPFIVNRILWGQYHAISGDAVNLLAQRENETIAGISCAYGEFIPQCVQQVPFKQLALFDVADIQLLHAKQKIQNAPAYNRCNLFLGNAESIALANNSVDCSVLFYLLHELPPIARQRVLQETLRITQKGGRLIIADYAPLAQEHIFHKTTVFRSIFEKMEPCLANFWRCDLLAELTEYASAVNKSLTLHSQKTYWNGFYRLMEFHVQ